MKNKIIKKNKKYIKLSLLAISLSLSVQQKASASGFPVVDIAGIVQSVTDYASQLQQYGEAIAQGTMQADELLTALDQYEQMAEEYTTMLGNLQDLQSAISAGDFIDAFGIITDSALGDYINPDYTEWAEEALDVWVAVDEARRGRYGGTRRTAEEILAEINDLFPDDVNAQEQAEFALNMQDSSSSQSAVDKMFIDQIDGISENLLRQEELIQNLGPESELQTLQAIGLVLVSQQKLKESELRRDVSRSQSGVSIEEILTMRRARAIEDEAIRLDTAMGEDLEFTEGE
jgi:hypothetical protein